MTRKQAVRSTLYRPALDPSGRLLVGAAVGINGDVAGRTERLLAADIDVLVVDTAHGHQDKMLTACKSVRDVRDRQADRTGRRIPLVAGNVVSADGVVDLAASGRRRDQGRSGTGRHVHHPDDDRRRPTAVQRRARVRGGRPGTGYGGVGRRWRALSAGRGAGAGRRRGQRHDRVVVRRHVREHGQPADRSGGPDVQGVVRDGLRPGGKLRTKDASGFDRARAALFEEGISSSRMYLDPERPSVEDLIDSIVAGVRSSCTYAGATTLTELSELAVVGVQSPSGLRRGTRAARELVSYRYGPTGPVRP